MLDKERCIKEHIYFEVLYVSRIKVTSKFSKCFLSVKFRTKFDTISVSRSFRITRNQTFVS